MKATILKRIQDRSAQVSVVGMGYVGLPLAVEFARGGFRVVGVDVIQLLDEKGAEVLYRDPYVPALRHEGVPDLSSSELIVDTRNAITGLKAPQAEIVKL